MAFGTLETFGVVAGIAASAVCIYAGVWMMNEASKGEGDDFNVWQPLGLYFIGKGVFVGPMLILTAFSLARQSANGRGPS